MRKVTFLIDGFNMYHSILSLKRKTGYSTKWLNLASLCTSYLHLFGKRAKLGSIQYFTAFPHYLQDAAKINRQETYLKCLEAVGVKINLGRFKEKDAYCPHCKIMFLKHEEKETDVSIGVTLIEVFLKDSCDVAVLVTGDTDLSPAIEKSRVLFPKKMVICAFPYARKNKELAQLAPGSFSIGAKQYIKHQFPNPFTLPTTGEKVAKPPRW